MLHRCPGGILHGMALHGHTALSLRGDRESVLLLTSDLPHRPRGSIRRQPTIRREEDFDEDRYSGEYYSGEEFYEEDGMLSGDRYHHCTLDQCSWVIVVPCR